MLTLLADALPHVEDPIPDTIGVDTVFAIAGAGGVIGTVIGSFGRSSERSRDGWTRAGLIVGFFAGAAFYLLSLAVQLLS
jgi:hypothetical protein